MCGTIQSNHGQFPDEFKNAKLSRGECIYIKSSLNTGSLLAVHWYDKRDVFVLSTSHGTGSIEVCCKFHPEFANPEGTDILLT